MPVDVANNLLAYASRTTFEGRKDSREGNHVQVVPAKRRCDGEIGGNKIPTYGSMMPIIQKALEQGLDHIDMTTATIAETSAIMQDIRRDPRRHVAMHGVPDLSDITDMTEPESPTLIRAPVLKAEAKSPTKRLAKLTTPIKKGLNRLAQNFVRLPPSSNPRVSPSPTKSSSSPSTPLKESPSPKLSPTPPAIGSSPLSASVQNVPEVSPIHSPGLVFKAPSYTDSSSPSTNSFQQSPERSSPVKYARPVAPTPSKWTRNEPTTPKATTFTPLPPMFSTPGQTDSPIGLASIVGMSTPKLPVCEFTATPDKANFEFGTVSPSFNSIPWMQTSDGNEPRRAKNVNAGRRRKSEPLFRKYMNQQARRQSISPQKVTFNDTRFRDRNSISALFSVAVPEENSETQVEEHTFVEQEVGSNESNGDELKVEEPTKAVESNVHPTIPAVEVERQASVIVDEASATSEAAPASSHGSHATTTDEHSVLEIDTRENPDIFATHSAVSHLARLTEGQCAGQAKTTVSQTNGKLVVRFKLPTKYAYMFPDNQGFDESHFSTSPSAILSSPRISFSNPENSIVTADVSTTSSKRVSFSLPEEQEDIASVPAVDGITSSPPSATSIQHMSTPSKQSCLTSLIANGNTVISTPEPTQVIETSSPMFSRLPGSAKPLSPLESTPQSQNMHNSPVQPFDISPVPGHMETNSQELSQTPSHHFTKDSSTETAGTPTSDGKKRDSDAQTSVTPRRSPPIVQSFTPVNQSTPRIEVAIEQTTSPAAEAEAPETHDDDDRAYIRNFINLSRSKPKQPSTTETGSPIAPPAKRQPLEARSPNMASPRKTNKHKLESHEEKASPNREPKEPPAKRTRRAVNPTKVKETKELKIDMVDHPEMEHNTALDEQQQAEAADTADAQQDDAETAPAPATRSSTRLRSQGRTPTVSKSSIPTPIKIGPSGPNARVMNSSVKKGQQDLQAQTRKNTKRNKGNAEFPAQVLAKYAGQSQSDESDESPEETEGRPTSTGTKRVGWREPLESIQAHKAEEDAPQQTEAKPKGRKTTAKPRAAQGSTAISKPKTAQSQTKRASKLAENLGMVSNGTPAKPQRVTRSRTRSQA